MSQYLDDTYWFPLWSNELNRYMTKEDWDNAGLKLMLPTCQCNTNFSCVVCHHLILPVKED